MPQAIIFETTGGPEVLKSVTYNISDPKPNEIQIRHIAIEVNYIDIYHRTGVYSLNYNPKIPGVSAIGEIVKIGDEINGFRVGDRVGYATASGGAYCEVRNVNSQLAFAVPTALDPKLIASCMLKLLTAHYLACRTYIVRPAIAVLIHAAAGGVGKLLAQRCNMLGAYVIGTVGSEEKKSVALANGCNLAINYNTEDWVAKIKEVTNGIGVNVVYDSVGQATYLKSLQCLMRMGMMVLYGSSSGAVSTIDVSLLGEKSLFFTRPSLFDYKGNQMELILSCNEIFTHLEEGDFKLTPSQEFKLSDAAEAHKLLESRLSTGSIILTP